MPSALDGVAVLYLQRERGMASSGAAWSASCDGRRARAVSWAGSAGGSSPCALRPRHRRPGRKHGEDA